MTEAASQDESRLVHRCARTMAESWLSIVCGSERGEFDITVDAEYLAELLSAFSAPGALCTGARFLYSPAGEALADVEILFI